MRPAVEPTRVLRAVSSNEKPLRHTAIFLFYVFVQAVPLDFSSSATMTTLQDSQTLFP